MNGPNISGIPGWRDAPAACFDKSNSRRAGCADREREDAFSPGWASGPCSPADWTDSAAPSGFTKFSSFCIGRVPRNAAQLRIPALRKVTISRPP